MLTLLVSILMLSSGSTSLPGPPRRNNVILNSSTPVRDGFAPSIGNGYISGDVGCCSSPNSTACAKGSCGFLHIGGVFNVRDPKILNENVQVKKNYTVPFRADIPNPHAGYVSHQDGSIWLGASLDLEYGILSNKTLLPHCDNATLTVETLAHYRTSHLVLTRFSIDKTLQGHCMVQWKPCVGRSVDFTVQQQTTFGQRSNALLRVKKTPLVPANGTSPAVDPIYVATTYTSQGSAIEFDKSTTEVLLVATYHTTLEGISPKRAMDAAVQDYASLQNLSWSELLKEHHEAWDDVLVGGIEVEGNDTVALTVTSSLYYVRSAIRADWPYSSAPGGLTRNAYSGHSFWDCETWMYPNLVALNPALARMFMQYREDRLDAARDRARDVGLAGAKWPWESALTGYGVSVVPDFDAHEIHISGDIVMAMRLYYYMSNDKTWLKEHALDSILETARYFASRFVKDERTGNYTLLNVVPPDELAFNQNSSAYTNAIAADTLTFAAAVAKMINVPADANWTEIADSALLLVGNLDGKRIHLEYDGYHGQDINQADVALMQYPLMRTFDREIMTNDLQYYQSRSSNPDTKGYYTGDSAYSIAWLQLGNRTAADEQFDLAFEHQDLSGFNVWMEKSFGDFGHLNFVTGAGGYLQNWINGYGGLRYSATAMHMNPVVPPHGVSRVTLRGLSYLGNRITVTYDEAKTTIELVNVGDILLELQDGPSSVPLALGKPITMKRQSFVIVRRA